MFNLNGSLTVEGQLLHTRDGLGISDTKEITIQANSDASFLLMEVPL